MTVTEAVSSKQSEVSSRQAPGGAIVIGGDYQGLGIVRSLGRHNVPVCIIDDERSIARFSRYATHAIAVDNLRDEDQAVQTILAVGKRLGLLGWVLYPTRDETVAALARNRDRLEPFFRVPTPDWSTVKWIWDKRNTYRLADRLAIPTPRTWYPQTIEDLDEIDQDPPFTVKPAIKEHFFYATKAKAWRADTRAQLRTLYRKASQAAGSGEVMIQDFIPGDGSHQFAYCAFYKNGRAIGRMTARRARQHPRDFGRASTFVETVECPVVDELSERFLREINYYGLVELEYKLDPRDGVYKLLDVNGRTWGYHTLGSGAGVDFPHMLFADLSGENVPFSQGRAGVSWVRLVTDLPMGLKDIVAGHQSWRSYFQSIRQAHVESVFCREDPLPGFAELLLLPYLSVRRGF